MEGYVELKKENFESHNGVEELNRMLRLLFDSISGDGITQKVYNGSGSPEGVVVADPGSIYMNRSGGPDTSLYVKESGSGATGWIPK